jgi:hypothetical protein
VIGASAPRPHTSVVDGKRELTFNLGFARFWKRETAHAESVDRSGDRDEPADRQNPLRATESSFSSAAQLHVDDRTSWPCYTGSIQGRCLVPEVAHELFRSPPRVTAGASRPTTSPDNSSLKPFAELPEDEKLNRGVAGISQVNWPGWLHQEFLPGRSPTAAAQARVFGRTGHGRWMGPDYGRPALGPETNKEQKLHKDLLRGVRCR